MELGLEACKLRCWPGVPRVFLDNNKEGLSIHLLHAVHLLTVTHKAHKAGYPMGKNKMVQPDFILYCLSSQVRNTTFDNMTKHGTVCIVE